MLLHQLYHRPTADLAGDSLLFVILHALVLVAIIIDLASGWRKAKRQGQARTSKALRRTISKINSYFSCLLLLSLIDVALYLVDIWERFAIPELPYFCALGTVFILIIELRSVYENRSFNDPARPDEDEALLSDKLRSGLDTLHALALVFDKVRSEGRADELASILRALEASKEAETTHTTTHPKNHG